MKRLTIGILMGLMIVILMGLSFSNRPIETGDYIVIKDADGGSHKVYWTAVETFAEDNIDAFSGSVAFDGGSTYPVGFTTENDITSTEVNGDTLGTATGGTFITYASRANQTVVTFSNYKMVITDSEGNGGHGSIELIDFPQGMIDINGVVADVSIDSVSGIGATGTFDIALGTTATATDNDVLAGTEVDIVAKVDGTLVSGADTIDLVNVTLANLDGHTTDAECYLNISVTDADMTATGWMAIYGTIVITWINLGDY